MADPTVALWDAPPIPWGEELTMTVTLTDSAGAAATGITAASASIVDKAGTTVLAAATCTEQSTGVWSAVWTATQMTDDVPPGRHPYVVKVTVDGKEQTVAAGRFPVTIPAFSGST